MKTYAKQLFVGFSALAMLMIGLLVNQLMYNTTKKKVVNELSEAFHVATSLDKDRRISEVDVYFSYENDLEERKELVINQENKRIPLGIHDTIRALSHAEKVENGLHSYLFFKNPIVVHVLDSFFQVELKKKQIDVATSIKYINNLTGEHSWSSPDSLQQALTLPIDRITLGVRDEMTLLAFAQITPWMVIRKAKGQLLVVCITWFVLMSLLVFMAVYKKKVPHVVALDEKDEKDAEPQQKTDYEILEHTYLDVDKTVLKHNELEIPLTKQLVQLMELFLSSPDYFVSYEVITKVLYGKIEEPKVRISQVIKRLRKLLLLVPELEIKNVLNKGYQLIIHSVKSKKT